MKVDSKKIIIRSNHSKKELRAFVKVLKEELKRYRSLSYHDHLTGLNNRRHFEKDLGRFLALQERHKFNYLVMMLDIDGFKKINDTKGHREGDRVLKRVSDVFKKCIRKTDRVYRLGGDEFIIVLADYKRNEYSYSRLINKYEHIIKRIKRNLKKIEIQVSIGYIILNKNVLETIDTKMYEDKRKIKP